MNPQERMLAMEEKEAQIRAEKDPIRQILGCTPEPPKYDLPEVSVGLPTNLPTETRSDPFDFLRVQEEKEAANRELYRRQAMGLK